MSKRGRILIVGENQQARALVRDCQGDRYRFTCCAGDNHAAISTGSKGHFYDWVVINGEMLGGDETDLIPSLRAMGFFLQDAAWSDGRGCGVEWLKDGSLQLHCCAHSQRRPPRIVAGKAQDVEEQRFIFEYHAPVKRTG